MNRSGMVWKTELIELLHRPTRSQPEQISRSIIRRLNNSNSLNHQDLRTGFVKHSGSLMRYTITLGRRPHGRFESPPRLSDTTPNMPSNTLGYSERAPSSSWAHPGAASMSEFLPEEDRSTVRSRSSWPNSPASFPARKAPHQLLRPGSAAVPCWSRSSTCLPGRYSQAVSETNVRAAGPARL